MTNKQQLNSRKFYRIFICTNNNWHVYMLCVNGKPKSEICKKWMSTVKSYITMESTKLYWNWMTFGRLLHKMVALSSLFFYARFLAIVFCESNRWRWNGWSSWKENGCIQTWVRVIKKKWVWQLAMRFYFGTPTVLSHGGFKNQFCKRVFMERKIHDRGNTKLMLFLYILE